MPNTTNENAADDVLTHRLALLRYESGTVTRMLAVYDEALKATVAELESARKKLAAGKEVDDRQRKRLEALARDLRSQVRDLNRIAALTLEERFAEAAAAEQAFLTGKLSRTIGITLRGIPVERVNLMLTDPIGGSVWRDRLAVDLVATETGLQGALSQALARGLSIPRAAAIVKGLGIAQTYRGRLVSIARTEMQRVANQVAMETYAANSDVIKAVQWLATLDTRTCFPAGTMIETAHGEVPIESVQVGDLVRTHTGRLRRVTGTVRRQHVGRMVLVRSGPHVVTATDEHPFRSGDGWIEAGQLQAGDVVSQRVRNGRPESVLVSGRMPLLTDQEMNGNEAARPYSCVAAGLLGGIAMPVGAVDLEGDTVIDKHAIDGEPADLHLNLEGEAELLDRASDVGLRPSFAPESPVASERTEDAIAARKAPEPDATVPTHGMNGGAPASLGAARAATRSAKELSAPDAWPVIGPAGFGAPAVPVAVAGRHQERHTARDADLLDPVFGAHKVAGPGAEGSDGGRPEDTGAGLAGEGRMLDLSGVVARPTAVDAPSLPGEHYATTTAGLFHEEIVTHLSSWVTTLDVFNIEVEEDRSYVANGFAVHNCLVCAPLHNTVYPIVNGRPQGLERLPPAHSRCRCAISPVLKSYQEMGLPSNPKGRSILDGNPAADQTFEQWLRKKPDSYADEVFGPTRAKMWRAGTVTLPEMVRGTRVLNLGELSALYPAPS